MTLTDTSRHVSHATETQPDFGYAAFWVLRITFGVVPIVVGVDKYFDNLVDWKQYLWSGVPNHLHLSAVTFMHFAGAIEIIAGITVLFAPQLGSALVAVWLAGIVANLVLVGFDEHAYWDIALRDLGLLLAAITLLLLASAYRPLRR